MPRGRKKEYDINNLVGADARYEYSVLPEYFDEVAVKAFLETTARHHRASVHEWDNAKNLEWTLRHYLALKLLLGATVMITSLRHAIRVNLRVVEPYLAYYSLLSCARALVLTDPTQAWRNGELFRLSHDKFLKAATQALRRLDRELGDDFTEQATFLKEWRERFSYSFPALGLEIGGGAFSLDVDGLTWICRVLAELSELNSQCLEKALDERDPELALDKSRLRSAARYKIGKFDVLDTDDAYRLGKIARKRPYPAALDIMAEYGLVEDFFGAWTLREDDRDGDCAYNPDADWYALFSFP